MESGNEREIMMNKRGWTFWVGLLVLCLLTGILFDCQLFGTGIAVGTVAVLWLMLYIAVQDTFPSEEGDKQGK